MPRRVSGPQVSFFAFQDIITSVVGIVILITLVLIIELAQKVERIENATVPDMNAVVQRIEKLKVMITSLQVELDQRNKAENAVAGVNRFNYQNLLEESQRSLTSLTTQIGIAEHDSNAQTSQLQRAVGEQHRVQAAAAGLESQRIELAGLLEQQEAMRFKMENVSSDPSLIYRDTTAAGQFVCLVLLGDAEIEVHDAAEQRTFTFAGTGRQARWRKWLLNQSLSKRHFFVAIRPSGTADFQDIRDGLDDAQATYGFSVVAANKQMKLGYEAETVE